MLSNALLALPSDVLTRLDDDLYAPLPGAFYLHVKYKAGGLCNRVTARHFVGVDPKTIEFVWIVHASRFATPREIADLCARKALKV